MAKLAGLEPQNVFRFFEEICAIPHGSRNVKQISDYLVAFAKERGIKVRQDEMYNVVMFKDATKGCEAAPTVMLQGHMDMVAVKTDDCPLDLAKDGLDLQIEGDLLYAKGTSLGGDDGIAVAFMLAILDDETIAHPALTCVFTTEEEIGMLGATALDTSDLHAKYLMNMDSEDEGVFTVSCAGGAMASATLKVARANFECDLVTIELQGLTGGHSGVEIHKGRLNSNIAMGRILSALSDKCDIRIVSVNGGEKDNAIALRTKAQVAILSGGMDVVSKTVHDVFDTIKKEYAVTDPDMELVIEQEVSTSACAMTKECSAKVLLLLRQFPNGIVRMNPEMEGLVQTSLNMGVLRTQGDVVTMTFAVRSAKESEKTELLDRLRQLTEFVGGTLTVSGVYPGWDYMADSKLREIMVDAYKEQYGKAPVVEGIHAGLECGIFVSAMPGLDAVSYGPQMTDIHTVSERLSISSTKRTWELTIRTLQALCEIEG